MFLTGRKHFNSNDPNEQEPVHSEWISVKEVCAVSEHRHGSVCPSGALSLSVSGSVCVRVCVSGALSEEKLIGLAGAPWRISTW